MELKDLLLPWSVMVPWMAFKEVIGCYYGIMALWISLLNPAHSVVPVTRSVHTTHLAWSGNLRVPRAVSLR